MTDERRFLQFLRRKASSFFSTGAVAYSRAPGRIDVMGGVADYCGSLVFEGTIAEAAFVAVQPRGDNILRVRTEGISTPEILPECAFPVEELHAAAKRADYPRVRNLFASRPGESWAGYVVGPLFVLWAEKVLRAKPTGLTVLLQSNVPLGSGVASSAAVEVATMRALMGAFSLELDGLEVARLCQKAENLVVGAPCGIMDQVTCALGEAGKLVALRCQPHDVLGLHSLPSGLRVMGVNSGVKHSVGGARYARARVGAFMGLKILSEENGGNNWGGYLTRIAPEEFRLKWCHLLPSRIEGEEFLDRYGEVDDVVARVDPSQTYSVRACTEHPIYENRRVERFIENLSANCPEKAGLLMYGSHWSYGNRCGLGCRETDSLVAMAKAAGARAGVYGAKITGGGSGGTVAFLTNEEGTETVRGIASRYHEKTGLEPKVFDGTSVGAMAFGHRQVVL